MLGIRLAKVYLQLPPPPKKNLYIKGIKGNPLLHIGVKLALKCNDRIYVQDEPLLTYDLLN